MGDDFIAEIYGVKTMDKLLKRMDRKLKMDDTFMREIGHHSYDDLSVEH